MPAVRVSLFLVALALLAVGCQASAQELSFDYSPQKLGKALRSGRPTVVEFGSPWCTECVAVAPIVEKLKQEYRGRATILTAEVTEAADLAGAHGVVGAPAFLFFDARGRNVRTLVGFRDETTLRTLLESLVDPLSAGRVASANQEAVTSPSPTDAPSPGSDPSGPSAIPQEIRVKDLHREGNSITLALVLSQDHVVLARRLVLFLDGQPLRLVATTPDISSERAEETVFVSGGEPITVVAEGDRVAVGDVLEVQLSVAERGCCSSRRDLYTLVSVRTAR
ncbi:MAG TPA: thioredoxin family protein [Dehalococcoidia bacterium]|nr:thioredoxin family protein [Dehalococcoidia bacterium]